MIDFLRFIAELLRALYHEARFRYYRAAYRYCEQHRHPDTPLLARRMVQSQMVVSDFIRQSGR